MREAGATVLHHTQPVFIKGNENQNEESEYE
jgi:hypothetical protein